MPLMIDKSDTGELFTELYCDDCMTPIRGGGCALWTPPEDRGYPKEVRFFHMACVQPAWGGLKPANARFKDGEMVTDLPAFFRRLAIDLACGDCTKPAGADHAPCIEARTHALQAEHAQYTTRRVRWHLDEPEEGVSRMKGS